MDGKRKTSGTMGGCSVGRAQHPSWQVAGGIRSAAPAFALLTVEEAHLPIGDIGWFYQREPSSPSVATALHVFRPPQTVGVTLVGNAPVRDFWEGRRYTAREIAGPWRVSGQWRSESNWCREERDVRLAAESAERVCRIAYDPWARCWYVQGTYDWVCGTA